MYKETDNRKKMEEYRDEKKTKKEIAKNKRKIIK
jgi:hypothetical protein